MKIGRQNKIIELINIYDVETQEELAQLLINSGYNVTQATVSRDIRELKLSKVVGKNGKQKYAILQNQESILNERFVRILKEGFYSMDIAQNLVIIKTMPGMAMAVGAAIDALKIDGIVGCIAGDDTIMCAIRSSQDATKTVENINNLLDSD